MNSSRAVNSSAEVLWHGTEAELLALVEAIQRYCLCRRVNPTVEPGHWCAAHQLLFADQRAMDGLLFARHIAERLQREEFATLQPS